MLSSARLIPVVGKGGVGRSTIALTLALAAEAEGRNVLLVEMGGASDIPPLLGIEQGDYEPRALSDGIDIMTLTAVDCLTDFARRKLKLPGFIDPLIRSKPLSSFVHGVPGLQDLLQLGKVEDLMHHPKSRERRYDLCVLDAPATGHGLTLLSAPRTLRELTHSGPFTELARTIEEFLHSELTTLVGVTLPEPLPVSESIELSAGLAALDLNESLWILNRAHPTPLPDSPEWPVLRDQLAPKVSNELLAFAERAVGRLIDQREALRLLATLPCPVHALHDATEPPRTLAVHRQLGEPLRALFRMEET